MKDPAIWFPTIRTGTGTDIFTIRLAEALNQRGIRAEIAWLPHRAEYAPWTVAVPIQPAWANIVHINSWLHRRFIPSGLPLVVTLHSCVHDPSFTPYKDLVRVLYHRAWIKPCESHNLRQATTVTAVSRYTAEQARQVFGRDTIQTIYNWVDTDVFCPDRRSTPHQPFRLLFVGKPSRRKGCDLLPDILRRLGPGFELYYTGTPEDLGVSEIPENMIALGRFEGDAALVAAYREVDALLFPSRLEGLSLVMLEAQACGRPVIAADTSSLPEVVEHGQTGILCPVDQVESFVAAARRLRDQPDSWQRMCQAGRARATMLFGESSAVNAWINTYRRLI